MPRAAKAKAILTIFILLGSVLFLVFGVGALSTGISREMAKQQGGDLAAGGCSCHNSVITPNITISHNVPPEFEANKKYSIWVNFSGNPPPNPAADTNKGGFNVLVSSGKLSPAEEAPQKDYTHLLGVADREITHTVKGDKEANRSFNFVWDSAGAGDGATFVITVNAVDGNGLPTGGTGDNWNRLVVSSILKGKVPETSVGGAGAKEVALHKLGIHSLAYWIGVVSFAVLFIIYGATFFLFKYGESSATTDHHDRPGAVEDFTGAPILKSKLMLMLLVAAMAIILVIVLLYQRGLFNA